MAIMFDLCNEFNFKQKIPNIIVQLIFWMLMTYIILQYVLIISNGYLPIYTFLFFIAGYFIYQKLLRFNFTKTLKIIKKTLIRYQKPIKMFFIPVELIAFLPKMWRFIKKTLKKLAKKVGKIFHKTFKKIGHLFKKIFIKKKKIADTNQLVNN